ncbi:MAG: DUF2244 domain-containing protein [Betaproteobacteria bacterium]
MSTPPPYRFATAYSSDEEGRRAGLRWTLRRNCSLSPGQLLSFYFGVCAVSLVIAGGFWFMGATLVLPFASVEIAVLGAALLIYARHAGDGETIILQGPMLVVERDHGGATERTEFSRDWVRVEPSGGDGSLIEVSGQGRRVVVGRHLRPELRPALAREIRMALRGA